MIVPLVLLPSALRVFVARTADLARRTASSRCGHTSVTNSDSERQALARESRQERPLLGGSPRRAGHRLGLDGSEHDLLGHAATCGLAPTPI